MISRQQTADSEMEASTFPTKQSWQIHLFTIDKFEVPPMRSNARLGQSTSFGRLSAPLGTQVPQRLRRVVELHLDGRWGSSSTAQPACLPAAITV